jgi:hypothetical protein
MGIFLDGLDFGARTVHGVVRCEGHGRKYEEITNDREHVRPNWGASSVNIYIVSVLFTRSVEMILELRALPC